jgi:arylsulfatase A-like enzyme
VPGVFFCNRKIDAAPSLMDIAPTVLDLFGLEAPRHMQGKALWADAGARRAAAGRADEVRA